MRSDKILAGEMADVGLCYYIVQKFCVRQQFRFSLPFCHNDCFIGGAYYLSQEFDNWFCTSNMTKQIHSVTTQPVQLFKFAKLSDCTRKVRL